MLLMCNDRTVNVFWPLRGCRQKEARDSTPCKTQPESPSITWEEGILVEQHRASSVVSYVEPVREELVVNIIKCLLQGDDVPFSCNLFLDSALSSTSRSWIPVVDA